MAKQSTLPTLFKPIGKFRFLMQSIESSITKEAICQQISANNFICLTTVKPNYDFQESAFALINCTRRGMHTDSVTLCTDALACENHTIEFRAIERSLIEFVLHQKYTIRMPSSLSSIRDLCVAISSLIPLRPKFRVKIYNVILLYDLLLFVLGLKLLRIETALWCARTWRGPRGRSVAPAMHNVVLKISTSSEHSLLRIDRFSVAHFWQWSVTTKPVK